MKNMKNMKIARLFGVDLKLHWSFLGILVFVASTSLFSGETLIATGINLLFVLAVFSFIVVHEFAHVFAARYYGIETESITLMIIGGLARLERLPEEPQQEFIVALAGPVSNMVLAPLFLLGWHFTDIPVLIQFSFINSLLAIFNLAPAFPMDGGRMLRAILAARIGRKNGTIWAFRVGVTLAVCAAVAAVFIGHPMLILIAGFIGLAGYKECQEVKRTESLRGVKVADLVIVDGIVVPQTTTVAEMFRILMHSAHQTITVGDGENILSVIPRADIIERSAKGDNRTAAEMGHSIGVTLDTDLSSAINDLRLWKSILVYDDKGDFAGVLDRDAVDRWVG